jgi:hypothetical protein
MIGRRQTSHHKLIILLAVSLLFSAAFAFILSQQPIILVRSDHYSRWYATYKLVTEGRDLYDSQNGEEIVALNTLPFDPVEGSFFYPAYLIAFTMPLVWMPYPAAHFIWLTLIQLFLITGIWLLYREIKWPHTVNQFTVFLLLSMVFIPNIQNTIWGQFNTLAVISLVLVYLCLRHNRYLLAGLLMAGMTFKPQQMLLTLLFLLLWSLFKRERRRLLPGFGLGMAALWLLATIFDPDWVSSFLRGVRAYTGHLRPEPVLGLPGYSGWIFFGAVGLFCLWTFARSLASGSKSVAFAGCVLLSLGTWWLYVPVLGMLHLVALPTALMLLFASLEQIESRYYSHSIALMFVLYGLGLIGFLYGLSSTGLYGLHIWLAELTYKLAAPILLVVLAIPLCFSGRDEILV